jgi:hypothetical protein
VWLFDIVKKAAHRQQACGRLPPRIARKHGEIALAAKDL